MNLPNARHTLWRRKQAPVKVDVLVWLRARDIWWTTLCSMHETLRTWLTMMARQHLATATHPLSCRTVYVQLMLIPVAFVRQY